MSDLRTAAQQALEALEYAQQGRECSSTTRQAITALRAALAQQAEPAQEPYTGDVTRIIRDAGMTFHLGPPHKAVVEQMTRGVDLVYAEASIKTAQQFSAALAQQAKPVWMHPWPPVRAQQAEPVSADPHTTTLRNLLKFCLPWEPDACVLGNVTARQAVAALRAALAQQAEPLNLADPAVRKRLATQWGYVPAAQAEPVEPVAWKQGSLVTFNEDPYPALGGLFVQFWDGEEVAARVYANDLKTLRQRCAKVNTAPPQRKPLTEEEIVDAVREADLDWQKGWTLDETQSNRFVTLARAVERAHGIKE